MVGAETRLGRRRDRLIRGADQLTDFQRTPASLPSPYLHFLFCRTCGARPFTRGDEGDKEFHAINLGCLDDATDAELAAGPIHYADGRHDDWKADAPASHYL